MPFFVELEFFFIVFFSTLEDETVNVERALLQIFSLQKPVSDFTLFV
jgi:hypothetical protein